MMFDSIDYRLEVAGGGHYSVSQEAATLVATFPNPRISYARFSLSRSQYI